MKNAAVAEGRFELSGVRSDEVAVQAEQQLNQYTDQVEQAVKQIDTPSTVAFYYYAADELAGDCPAVGGYGCKKGYGKG